MIYLVFFGVFLTTLAAMLLTPWLAGRRAGVPLARLADPAPLPGELVLIESVYGAFPVDTEPLLLLSDAAAANAQLEREVQEMIRKAERKIGPVR